MNGLKFIRTRCNISATVLADYLGVTRQMVCAWENGRKEIPEKRKNILADYFGIDKCYLGEISEEDIEKLMHSAMHYYINRPDRMQLRFGNDQTGNGSPVCVDDENFESVDKKLQKAKDRATNLEERISKKIRGNHNTSIIDEIRYIERSCEILEYAEKILDALENSHGHDSEILEYEIKDAMDALMIFLKKKTSESVEENVYLSEGLLRISCFGAKEICEAYEKNDDNYQKQYRMMYSDEKSYKVIYTYGIRNIDYIVESFSDEYDVIRADDSFADIITANSDAIFINPHNLNTDDFKFMNDVFRHGSPLTIFTSAPWYRLDFKYYLVSDSESDFRMYKRWFDEIQSKHRKLEKV